MTAELQKPSYISVCFGSRICIIQPEHPDSLHGGHESGYSGWKIMHPRFVQPSLLVT